MKSFEQILREDKVTSRDDYEVTYAKNGSMAQEVAPQPHTWANSNGESKSPIKGDGSQFEYNDGGWGPVDHTGGDKAQYEARYKEGLNPVHRRVSPALRESARTYEIRKRLLENKIITPEMARQLKEADYYDEMDKDFADPANFDSKWDYKFENSDTGFDEETFLPEAQQLADRFGDVPSSYLDIMNSCSSAEEAAMMICDHLQLDQEECDEVYDILEVPGDRNRDFIDEEDDDFLDDPYSD